MSQRVGRIPPDVNISILEGGDEGSTAPGSLILPSAWTTFDRKLRSLSCKAALRGAMARGSPIWPKHSLPRL